MTPGGVRCYLNVIEGAPYCPGHIHQPEGELDVQAVADYQRLYGVDYPCGKPEDMHRLFDPADYHDDEGAVPGVSLFKQGHEPQDAKLGGSPRPDYHIKGGVPVPLTQEDIKQRLQACDDALDAFEKATDYQRTEADLPEGMTLADPEAGLARVEAERERLCSDTPYTRHMRLDEAPTVAHRDLKPPKRRSKKPLE